LARARYRARYGFPGVDPAADIARALEVAPDDAEVLLAAADLARRKGDLDTARARLEHGLDKHPDSAALYQAMASLETGAGRPEEAVSWLRKGIEAQPKGRRDAKAAMAFLLADTLVDLGRPDDAEAAIKDLRTDGLRPELISYL